MSFPTAMPVRKTCDKTDSCLESALNWVNLSHCIFMAESILLNTVETVLLIPFTIPLMVDFMPFQILHRTFNGIHNVVIVVLIAFHCNDRFDCIYHSSDRGFDGIPSRSHCHLDSIQHRINSRLYRIPDCGNNRLIALNTVVMTVLYALI